VQSTSKRILVVDDDPDLRLLLATVLEMEGAEVLTAANGLEGLKLAVAHAPSVIVLDLMMPVMGGEDFRRSQLADTRIRDIPVVVVSAHHDTSAIATHINAAGYLIKPLDLDTFARYISERAKS
jgi:CheY-like chemotaxis protein